ncbi:hypothetical protein RM553_18600 [Zunongwangia sp. F363]|uniref:Uncharacterized protein n=1 Tax=Autumnicola tepida TaxID=3075595 RepID=A0ABU3CET3_9FLAO|nr:hypothetical protein [Zunongwangia sp. F363]MDT0644854.1 hypothetical protein [Zunongwangia sp. F363]
MFVLGVSAPKRSRPGYPLYLIAVIGGGEDMGYIKEFGKLSNSVPAIPL